MKYFIIKKIEERAIEYKPMKVLFFDENTERMHENFEFFSRQEDVIFAVVRNVKNISDVSNEVDFVVIYDSDNVSDMEYLRGNVFLICEAENYEILLKSFLLAAKPLYGDIKTERLYRLLKEEKRKDAKYSSTHGERIMNRCGIPKHLRGYDYILAAIELCCRNQMPIGSVTKEIYPLLSKMFDTVPSNVERSIRNAIEHGWNNKKDYYNTLFMTKLERRPSNKTFINAVVDRLMKN